MAERLRISTVISPSAPKGASLIVAGQMHACSAAAFDSHHFPAIGALGGAYQIPD
jgi:hypothetical protein